MFKQNNYLFVENEFLQNVNVLNDTQNGDPIDRTETGGSGSLLLGSNHLAETNNKIGFWNKKVLYIYPGHEDTYIIINQGIIDGLGELVSEVYTAKAEQDAVNLAAVIMPDLVLVLCGDTFPIKQVNVIRAMGIKTAVWFTDDPYITDITTNIAPHYQYVFTQELSCVSYYQMLGCRHVHYLPLAVNTKVFYHRIKSEDNSIPLDICFMGAGWNNRISLFDQIASYLSKKNTLIVGSLWDRLRNYHILSDKIRFGFLSPEESVCLINQSKIVINNHRSYDDSTLSNRNSNKLPALSINPRTFEISACCAFQLSDVRQELNRFYEVGKEIETYSSPSELIEKIEYYLNHEERRDMIARRGHVKTLKNHTYPKRLETLLKVIFG